MILILIYEQPPTIVKVIPCTDLTHKRYRLLVEPEVTFLTLLQEGHLVMATSGIRVL